MTLKTTHDNLVLVNTDWKYTPIDPDNPPPKNVKMQLINKNLGVSVIGTYDEKQGFTHYAGLPTFERG